ncbi:MAG: hypothetical protein DMG61_10170 [Acidobacteria bacterium]|nr:MAG: hypothetical protein DMG61_10170 [Acidobacteriota bacterium]PYY19971.1 MAG: hypothetical protein DMG60_02005 [Acidobacteriota bacterium]
MKVIQLGPYPPPHGGVQTNLVAIHRYLHAHGIQCAAINLTRHRRNDEEGVYYPKNALGVLRLLWKLDYEIAHLHVGGNLSFRLLALGVACSLIPGKKVVLTFHSGGYPSSPAGVRFNRSKLRTLALRCFDCVIAVNSEIVRFFEKSGVPRSRIKLISPFSTVELPTESHLPLNLAAFCEAHDPVLLSVGGLEPEYDIPIQIDVLGAVQQSFPQAGLVIIGGGSRESQLRTIVQNRSYSRDILLCGDVPHGITLRAMSRARLILRTTLYDGDSIAVREALQLGIPVIATDNGMRPSGVRLIPSRDFDKLKNAIEDCLHNPMPAGIPEITDENNLMQILSIYRELVGAQCSVCVHSLDLPQSTRC